MKIRKRTFQIMSISIPNVNVLKKDLTDRIVPFYAFFYFLLKVSLFLIKYLPVNKQLETIWKLLILTFTLLVHINLCKLVNSFNPVSMCRTLLFFFSLPCMSIDLLTSHSPLSEWMKQCRNKLFLLFKWAKVENFWFEACLVAKTSTTYFQRC